MMPEVNYRDHGVPVYPQEGTNPHDFLKHCSAWTLQTASRTWTLQTAAPWCRSPGRFGPQCDRLRTLIGTDEVTGRWEGGRPQTLGSATPLRLGSVSVFNIDTVNDYKERGFDMSHEQSLP